MKINVSARLCAIFQIRGGEIIEHVPALGVDADAEYA